MTAVDDLTSEDPEPGIPEELSPRRLWRRLLQFALVGAVIVALVLAVPSLGKLRHEIAHASVGWLFVGILLEVLSALCYVLVFRAVFCSRMSWRLSYQIGMAEQGANSVLSVSGAGGLALGAWALRRGGMGTEHIARRSVAFFFLTSLANVAVLIVLAFLYAIGVLHHDRDPPLTYIFGAAALLGSAIVALGLPRLRPPTASPAPNSGRITQGLWFVRNSLGQGVRDALRMLRRRPAGILVGSFGVMGFDLAVLGVCFKAFGYSPAVGILALGYLIGQLGGNLPVPGGIGGIDAGLIGTFALYHQPLAATTAAVLAYHAIALWIPGLLGSLAFVQLRRTLLRESQPAAICMPLAEPIESMPLPATLGAGQDASILDGRASRNYLPGLASASNPKGGSAVTCTHLDQIKILELPESVPGCEECLRDGSVWVHLRICLTCGHVGCCDDSPNRHATAHSHSTGHPLIHSLEPGDGWTWCYVDEVAMTISEIRGHTRIPPSPMLSP